MNTLLSQAINNLKKLKDIEENQILVLSGSRELNFQDDYIQIENISELENGIHFTFHQILSSLSFLDFEKSDQLIKDMDIAIDRIFDNIKLNELIENETNHLCEIINNIDHILELYKESIFYKSPFYKCMFSFYNGIKTFKKICQEINKQKFYLDYTHYIKNEITGELDPNLIYSDTEEESDNDSDNDNDNDNDSDNDNDNDNRKDGNLKQE